MSELWEKQVLFGSLLPRLLDEVAKLGYVWTPGHILRCHNCLQGHQNSLHKRGLAIDINLFLPDGTYLNKTEDHQQLGNFWRSLNPLCCWGGEWGDGNHYSIKYRGMK